MCSFSQQQSSANQLNSSTDILNSKSNSGITIVKLNSPPPISTPSLPSGPQSIGAIGTMSRSSNTTNATSSKTSTLGPFTKQRNSRSSPSSPKEMKRNAKITPYNNNKAALGGHILTIHTSTANTNTTITAPTSPVGTPVVPPTPPHTGYTRRVKLGDSRSTGRLHPAGNSHRSGSVGGLHKSMTKLSSSQQINQNGNGSNTASRHNVATAVVGGNNVTVSSGNSKSTKVSSGGVTVTTSHARIRPHSQGPITLVGSTGALVKYSNDAINQSTGSIASPGVLVTQPTSSHFFSGNSNTLTLPVNTDSNHEVIISGPTTNVTPRRNDNTSYTLLNTMRMSTFEPYQITRDPVQQFCEKNFASIKTYMDQLSQFLPPPTRCSIEGEFSILIFRLYFDIFEFEIYEFFKSQI